MPDDLIVYVDGEPVVSIQGFNDYIAKTNPGNELTLEVRRGDKLIPIKLTLEEHPKKN